MKKIKLNFVLLFGFLLPIKSMAVFLNHKGLGEAFIIPYYTVNNNLNTLVTVTNTTHLTKAMKINIREGLHGHAVLSYNVYIAAFDTWSFGLVPTTSTLEGYEGQNSAMQISFDNSCAPFLNKAGQEFIAENLNDGPQSLQRVREGFVEIIEMGTSPQGTAVYAASDLGGVGYPASCAAIENFWQTTWLNDSTDDLLPPTGKLMVEAQVIDVAEGINYSIPTIALDDFHVDEAITHVHPDDASLSLDVAKPVASLVSNNQSYELAFESGIDAVSAVLMSDHLISTYALDAAIAAKTETIYTQPTRRFYVGFDDDNPSPPFDSEIEINPDLGYGYGGTAMKQFIYDRESQIEVPELCEPCPPSPPADAVYGSVFAQAYYLDFQQPTENPGITQSINFINTITPNVLHATQNGFVNTEFLVTSPLIGTDIHSGHSVEIWGLPITGITLQRFTNAGAGENLLAQYGGGQLIKSTVSIIDSNQ